MENDKILNWCYIRLQFTGGYNSTVLQLNSVQILRRRICRVLTRIWYDEDFGVLWEYSWQSQILTFLLHWDRRGQILRRVGRLNRQTYTVHTDRHTYIYIIHSTHIQTYTVHTLHTDTVHTNINIIHSQIRKTFTENKRNSYFPLHQLIKDIENKILLKILFSL